MIDEIGVDVPENDPTIVTELVISKTIYLELAMYAALLGWGAFCGLIRWASSNTQASARVIFSSMSISAILGFAIIAGYWGSEVIKNPWGCASIVTAIGFLQPNAVQFFAWFLKSKGIQTSEPEDKDDENK